METYESLLEKAYSKVKIVESGKERFEIPAAEGQICGKNTIISNINTIASYLRRPVEHLAKFLQKELASPGKLENERLILNTKIPSSRINEKIQEYAKEFVICTECKKPDTEIITEKNIKFKHCLACGARSPVRSSI